MEWIAIWLALAVVCAIVANAKGRSGFGYFILGLLLPLIGVLLAIGLPTLKPVAGVVAPVSLRGNDFVMCHKCGRPRRVDSVSCPHCRAAAYNPADNMKKCPACAETIQRAALKCRYCGTEQPVMTAEPLSVVRPLPPEIGHCPQCRRERQQFDLGCTACGSKKPAVFA